LLAVIWWRGQSCVGPTVSEGRGISSQAAKFAFFRGILILQWNFAGVQKWPMIGTIVRLIV